MLKLNVTKVGHFTGHKDCIYALEASVHDECFYSGGGEGYVVEWNHKEKGDGKMLVQVNRPVYSLLLDRQQNHLYCGAASGNLHVIDLQEGKEVRNIEAHEAGIFDIKKVNGHLITSGGDGVVNVWTAGELVLQHQLKASDKSARVIAVSPDEEEFAVGFSDHKIRTYDLRTFQLKETVDAHSNSVFALAYSPDHQYLLSGGRDVMLRSWKRNEAHAKELDIPAHTLHINAIAYNPAATLFVTVSMDKTIKLWDARSFELLKVIDKARNEAHASSVNKVMWLNDREFLTCSDDRTVMMWQIN